MKWIQKMYILVCLGMALLFNSCDFGTREFYEYSTADEYQIYITWINPSSCEIIYSDETIKYDGLKLFFPSDNSVVEAGCEIFYTPTKNDKNEIIDSTANYDCYFEIPEDDSRIINNSFIILTTLKGKQIVSVDTLYRKKKELTLIDQLPLPKLH